MTIFLSINLNLQKYLFFIIFQKKSYDKSCKMKNEKLPWLLLMKSLTCLWLHLGTWGCHYLKNWQSNSVNLRLWNLDYIFSESPFPRFVWFCVCAMPFWWKNINKSIGLFQEWQGSEETIFKGKKWNNSTSYKLRGLLSARA